MSEEKISGHKFAYNVGDNDFAFYEDLTGKEQIAIRDHYDDDRSKLSKIISFEEFEQIYLKVKAYKAGTLFPKREAKPKPQSWQSKSEEIKKKSAEKTELMVNRFKEKSFDKLQDKFEIEE